jgi:amino acid adenylation domain-containing protein
MRVRATRIGDDRFRLHLSADVLFVDARSRALLFSEWKQLYQNGKALREPQASFRDYVLEKQAQRQHPEYLSAREFWARRIETLPHAPDLPLAKSPEAIGRPRFERHESPLDAEPWARLRRRAETREIRPAVLLLAAFAEVLRAWSRSRQFTINLTLFDRLAREPRFHNVAGDFTSSLLLAVEPRGNQTLKERVSNLQQVLRECLRHSAMSGVEVIREHLRRTSGGHPALMPVVFTSFLAMERDLQEAFLPTWLGTPVYEITQTPQVWLDMQVRAQAGALYLAWDVVRGLFPDGMIADMFGSLVRLLLALADDDAAWSEPWEATVRRLLPTSQRERRAAYNATLTNVPGGGLHEPFFKQAARRPNHPALITPDKVLSYGELQARALRLAEILKPDLSGSDTLIAVAMKRGWEQVVGVLGVLASGAAYLPVDPDLPSERVRLLLEDGRVDTVLTQSHVSDRNDWPRGIRRICVDRLDSSPASGFAPQRPRGCELAYVIYTSGTTGRPKGVMVEHTAALNTVLDINTRFGIGPDDCVLAVSALSFDLSVYDLFGALATGGSIVFPAAEHSGEPAGWAQLIRLHSVTVWNSVPTLMMLLLEHLRQHPTPSPSSLRLVLLSGDWIPVRLPDQIRTEFPQARVVGLGGATEAAIWSIHYPVERVDPAWPSIPYGRPLSNQRVHVLNTALETCPDWVAGDLYIGGQGLARGYWRDPGLTAERFVVHPATGERLYHTGDMGRFLPEGDIEFLGREDAQVKVQGFRVELGEIESTLAEHPAVKSCVVTAHGSVEEGRRLVAHVVPEAGGRPAAEELRRFLDTRLPRYMVPSTFHFVSALPTGPTGKVDRKALSAVNPDVVEPAARPDADGTGVVHTIVGELAGILGVERETNLLAFGLTSVDIIRIANRVEAEFGIRVPLGEFYRDPNVRYLERLIAGRGLGAEQPDDVRRSSLGYHAQPQSQLLLDPLEREAFKNSRRSMRHFDAEVPTIALRGAPVDDNRGRQSATRRSHRRFSDRPLALVALDGLLDMLRAIPVQGGTKRRYGSAGGLYPIQTYLFVRDGKVEGLAAGTYYHNPWTHQLAAINDSECIQASAYDPFVNGPLFEASAFALFLVADLDAIAPLYGDRSAHYATIEAGLICQLLETEGPSFGIGLCQVGEVEYTTVHRALRLEGRHWFVHSLLGGPIDTADEWVPHTESYCVAQTGDDAKCSERRPLAVRGDGS